MFTHLHVASGYSVRYGGSMPDELAARAAELDLPAVALTDRDTVAGAVRFAQACARAGVRPVFGANLAVPLLEPPATATVTRRRTPARGGVFVDESALRVTLLSRDGVGRANLCALITAAWAARAEAGGGQPILCPGCFATGERLTGGLARSARCWCLSAPISGPEPRLPSGSPARGCGGTGGTGRSGLHRPPPAAIRERVAPWLRAGGDVSDVCFPAGARRGYRVDGGRPS
ncbi:PHP domain-containing protein [Kitasatospora herbaricolor]|uniref:PHP domain-containing protein n=1 Tax=Kitasatospora herbaricolor TaxID=68217 RepID=UPI0039A51DD6